MEERRAELMFNIMKQGEENFEQYLAGNTDVFVNVKKTYGNKISEKMKSEQRDEFLGMVQSQYEKRRQDMDEIHNQILSIDKQLDECDRNMESNLPQMIAKAQRAREQNEDMLISLNEQLDAFVIAENEVLNQIENFLE